MATEFLTTEQRAELIKLYIAYFNRAPESQGLDFHVTAVLADLNAGVSFEAALVARANNFYTAAVDLGTFSAAQTAAEFVQTLYTNVLLRPADGTGVAAAPTAAEIAFWADQVSGDTLTRGELALKMLEAAAALKANPNQTAAEKVISDAVDAALVNRVAVAVEFSKPENSGNLTGTDAVTQGQLALQGVTADPATVAPAIAAIQGGLVATSLTTGVDNLLGTNGGETYNAVNGSIDTLTIVDIVNGGGGNDTLNLLLDGGGVAAINNVTNVEYFFFRDLGANATVDLGLTNNEMQVWSDRSTGNMTFNNVNTGAVIGVKGDGSTTNGSTTAAYVAGATAGVLAIDGGTTAGAIAVNGAGLTSLAINSTGAANVVGAVSSTGTPTAVTINAATGLTMTSLAVASNAAAQSLTVSGAAANSAATATAAANAAVVIGTLDTDFATVDASGLTAGGISASLSAVTQTVTGGAGDDMILTNGQVLTTGSVNAGGGTGDRLVVTASADITATTGAKYTNFEVLQVQNNQSVDIDNIGGITSIVLNDTNAANNTTVTDLSAAQAGAITLLNYGDSLLIP